MEPYVSRALDMILTGRPVDSAEAYAMGLANRVVEDGAARAYAQKLAAQIARFPQACMRNDRIGAYEQFCLNMEDALKNEFTRGMDSLNAPGFFDGLERYSKGEGRHGDFSA